MMAVSDTRQPPGWTHHHLNSGVIFRWTCKGVSRFPPAVSYGIGHVGTWLAWRTMSQTRAAVADNLSAIFPGDSRRQLERRALSTIRAYANDVIDFIRAIEAPEEELPGLADVIDRDARVFRELLGAGRGLILVTGHYGNWEIGGVLMRRLFKLPLTVVTMPEVSPEVDRLRRSIRQSLGVESIEVRRSLDTPLRIARELRENRIVAMLMDRHVDRDCVDVSFLGRTAAFLRTPALMGYLTGSPLMPCFIERMAPGRFRLRPGEPIVLSRERPREEAIQAAAQQFADQLSVRIRRHPQFWYQFYPYWESQPRRG
jgi:KDO2-lipid IV(A) lauroyltransferase